MSMRYVIEGIAKNIFNKRLNLISRSGSGIDSEYKVEIETDSVLDMMILLIRGKELYSSAGKGRFILVDRDDTSYMDLGDHFAHYKIKDVLSVLAKLEEFDIASLS